MYTSLEDEQQELLGKRNRLFLFICIFLGGSLTVDLTLSVLLLTRGLLPELYMSL